MRRALPFAAAAALAAFAAGAVEPAATLPRALALEDSEAVQYLGEPAVSRDGKLVAYAQDGQLFVVPVAGGTPRAVTTKGSTAWSPYWSKDGKSLYFLSNRSQTSQLWKLPLDGFGEAQQLTDVRPAVRRLVFSPDESRLLLRFADSDLAAKDEKPAEEPAKKPFVMTRLEFKEDAGEGYLTGDGAVHLYALEIASGKLTQLTSGAFTEEDPAWSPDGRRVAFVSNREADPDESYKTDLWLVAADTEDKGATLTRLTNDDRVKSSPVFSPDGGTIAFLSAVDGVYGAPQVAVIPASGREARLLTTAFDRWVDGIAFSADGQWIYFSYENLGGTRIARVRPRDGRIEPVLEGDESIGGIDLAKDGTIVAEVQAGNRGPELVAFADGRRTQLTHVNDGFLSKVALGEKESISFRSPDGTEVQAFVTKPPGFVPGRRYPTILHIHGGRSANSAGASTSSRSTSRRAATSSSSRTRAARRGVARHSCARSTRPGGSPTTTTSSRRSTPRSPPVTRTRTASRSPAIPTAAT